jgi:2-polyprenyl-6-methoxyphenol hydroxylase-like FAD-dependent oxidoreductase
MTTPHHHFEHAVVIGGSIAGLLAARVLANHFDQVTVVERDMISHAPEPRRGVPQGRHAHALLVRGKEVIETFFPGLTDDLIRDGATLVRGKGKLAWHHGRGWRIQYDSDLSFLSLSRPLLETGVASRVLVIPNVTVREQTSAEGLVLEERHTVRGVRLLSRPTHQAAVMDASLVIDASGRGSAMPRWLQSVGFPVPRTEVLPVPVTYATCIFEQRSPAPEWRTLVISGAPARRAGFVFAIEGGRWLVTLASFFDEPAPKDLEEFMSVAQSLAVPDIYEVIRGCRPVSGIVHYRFSGSQRRYYEALNGFPEGLLVLGDALCSFNPVYGQGMAVSAIEAERLDIALGRSKLAGGVEPDFARHWFQSISSVVDTAWDAISLEDHRFPELSTDRPLRLRALQWYMDQVQEATYRSPQVTEQFYRVMSFLDPPARLFRPRIAVDVLLGRRMLRISRAH